MASETRSSGSDTHSSYMASATTDPTRRDFLRTGALAGGGLVLSASWQFGKVAEASGPARVVDFGAWVRVGTDDVVTLVVSQAEIGQGTSTTLPAVLADEMGADWSRVRFENAPADPAYRNPKIDWQFTGNSESITSFFDLMRTMGASAREMLVATAAGRFGVDPSTCAAKEGAVVHPASGRRLRFGELAEEAGRLTPPKEPRLKPPSEWTLIGRSVPRVEIPDKVTGRAVFGIDVTVPGMAHAAVSFCPVFGGKPADVDRASVLGRPGVLEVVPLQDGVAVVAETYWQARQALPGLRVTWDEGPHAALDSASIEAQAREAMQGSRWLAAHSWGDGRHLADVSLASFEAEYHSQFLAHATMEPMNATAHVTAGGCELWLATQGQELTQLVVASVLGISKEKVRVHRVLSGGGFGRRLLADFTVAAVLASKAVGRPVKVIWSREDDMRHDFYRSGTWHRITARLDADGRPLAASHKLVSATQLQHVYPPAVTEDRDPTCLEGLIECHYGIPDWKLDFHLLKIGVPTSVLRTTGYGPNIFALECFVDELAHRAGRDPYLYRRELLVRSPRSLAVLNRAAEAAGWSRPAPAGRHRGIAFAEAFRTLIAQVVELSVEDRAIRVHKVTTALDAGTIVDPGNSTSQVEGGIAWGLSAALLSEVTFARGRAVEGNWNRYRIATLTDMPACETHFIDSGARPLGGVGEVGPVTLVPALVNAVFAATGRRVRSLPLSRHGFSVV